MDKVPERMAEHLFWKQAEKDLEVAEGLLDGAMKTIGREHLNEKKS